MDTPETAFHGHTLDYDARRIRELRFEVEPTRYPPGFSIKKRGACNRDAMPCSGPSPTCCLHTCELASGGRPVTRIIGPQATVLERPHHGRA